MSTSISATTERAAVLRFFRKAALMLPALLLVPVVNYGVDPANIFARPGEQEALIGAQLLAGKNVVNFERYDDRRIAKYLLEHRNGRPNVLVLGSSRTLNMGSYLFPRSRVMNASMLGSTIREVLAAYEIVHNRSLRPDTVIIGLDPWMLNADAYDERWFAIQPQFDSALVTLGIHSWPKHQQPRETQSRLGALFSAGYFQEAIKSLGTRDSTPKWYSSKGADNAAFTRLPDGSYTYSRVQRNKTQAETDALAARYTEPRVYLINDNAVVDSAHLRAIFKLLELIRRDGSQPVIYLPPYHPLVYSRLSADSRYSLVLNAENEFRKIGLALGVPVVGSYSPGKLNLTNKDFYDGHHLKESGLVKVFTKPNTSL